MDQAPNQSVLTRHIRRRAYLYLRQSSMRQASEHTESIKRQYALRQRAIALGWTTEQIFVIDEDQGQSGASAEGREGFQRLVAEVGMGNAGIMMGLEVSRLARNSSDWHQLVEICALTDTLILDEEGVYDPTHFNDRLVLGLKGTLSEAELHVLRARRRGGIISNARLGKLQSPVPVGLVHDERARGVVKDLRRENVLIPPQIRRGPRNGVIAEIDALLEHHTRGEIAVVLNERGRRSGEGKPFHKLRVWQLEKAYNLRSRHDRLRAAGMRRLAEIAAKLGVATATVVGWRQCGLLKVLVLGRVWRHRADAEATAALTFSGMTIAGTPPKPSNAATCKATQVSAFCSNTSCANICREHPSTATNT